MPFDRPTLAEITSRAREELRVKLGLGAVLPRSVEDVFARILSLHSHYLHAHLDWSLEQLVPSTSEREFLERWAAVFGVERRQATPSTGVVRATGSSASPVLGGTELRNPDGVLFRTTSAGIVVGGVVDLSVEAVSGGADGNLPVGAQLVFTSPPAGLNAAATVTGGGLIGGLDTETDEDLRTRLIDRIQQPPAGGAASDYERWALEVAGVDQAWVVPSIYGVGTVGVLFSAEGVDPVPSPALVAAVQAILDERRPVTAEPFALAPAPKAISFSIQLTAEPGIGTTALQAQVTDALTDLLARESAPNATLFRSAISQAISTTPGEASHILLAPTTDIVAGPLEIFTLGGVTWS